MLSGVRATFTLQRYDADPEPMTGEYGGLALEIGHEEYVRPMYEAWEHLLHSRVGVIAEYTESEWLRYVLHHPDDVGPVARVRIYRLGHVLLGSLGAVRTLSSRIAFDSDEPTAAAADVAASDDISEDHMGGRREYCDGPELAAPQQN